MEGKKMRSRLLLLIIAGVFFASPLRADLSTTIAKVKPSVVIVGTYKITNSPRFSMRGTGFVVSNGNLFVTNAHVLPQAAEKDAEADVVILIRLARNEVQMRRTTLLEVDKLHDLALLRFEGAAVPVLNVGDSDLVQEGKAIAFMGFPIGGLLGFSPVTHRGIVSSITAAALPSPSALALNEKAIRSLRGGGNFDIFQLDGTAYPGNSGGPMFDPDTGEVLGILNMVFIKGTKESALTNPSGISYAIPSKYVLQLLDRGKVK
jgi:serine protease Do